MVGLHSSDPATVFLACWARVDGFQTAHLETALYEDKELLRILGMRRTMWVVPTDFAPLVHSSSTMAMVEPQRKRLVKMLEEGGVSKDGDQWLSRVEAETLDALGRLGEATARELSEEVPALKSKIVAHKGDGSVLGQFGASTRVLFQLAIEGRVLRARPLGTWLSSQYRWSSIENWLGSGLPDIGREPAEDEVIRRWLRAFGPGTETDIKWWTGWPVTRVRACLHRIGAVSVDIAGGTGFLLEDDLGPTEAAVRTIAFLPSLDPTTMGWKERHWYLGDHVEQLFDRNGNAGPTIWVDGRIVGGWSQRNDGEISWEILEDVGNAAAEAVAERAAALERWLGGMNVTARFRSPHDKSLTEG